MNMTDARKLTPIETQIFGIRWLTEYLGRSSARAFLRRAYRRTPQAVIGEYEGVRRSYLDRFCREPMPLETYLVSEAEDAMNDRYLQILDGNLLSGALREATRRIQQCLIQAIVTYNPESVIEFGCGTGRNLLAIKRACPDIRCMGLELTQSSVELANLASQYYDLELEVHQADVTKPLREARKTDVCFSVHALEQIPNSGIVFDQMYHLARKAVVLFEPIVELYRWTPRDMAARIRAHHLDRLRGLYPHVLRKGYKIGLARLLDNAANALNPTAEMHVLSEPSRRFDAEIQGASVINRK
ncbi:MAG: class I SAM-dependent methyltransferase [Candidatus Acidiferrales bacterium]